MGLGRAACRGESRDLVGRRSRREKRRRRSLGRIGPDAGRKLRAAADYLRQRRPRDVRPRADRRSVVRRRAEQYGDAARRFLAVSGYGCERDHRPRGRQKRKTPLCEDSACRRLYAAGPDGRKLDPLHDRYCGEIHRCGLLLRRNAQRRARRSGRHHRLLVGRKPRRKLDEPRSAEWLFGHRPDRRGNLPRRAAPASDGHV